MLTSSDRARRRRVVMAALAAVVTLMAMLAATATAATTPGSTEIDDEGAPENPCAVWSSSNPMCTNPAPPGGQLVPCVDPVMPCPPGGGGIGGGGGGGGAAPGGTLESCSYLALSDGLPIGTSWALPSLQQLGGSVGLCFDRLPDKIRAAIVTLLQQGCSQAGYQYRIEFRYDSSTNTVTRVTSGTASNPALPRRCEFSEV